MARAKSFRLVGLTRLGNASFGGASIAQLTLPEAQRVTGKVGEFDQISIAAEEGISEETLKQRVAKVTPPSVLVETAKQNSERNSNEIRDELGFLRIALLVFAFVALLVGAFLIFNTFSITVAQRITEFGMLRTLGASRSQILTSVVVEALAIGILGAVLGLAGGFAIAKGLNALFVAIGIDLPTTSLVDRDPDHRRLAGDRDRRHPGLVAGPGAALDPGAADRRPAGARDAAQQAARGRLRRTRGAARRRRPGDGRHRPLRRRQRRESAAGLIGAGAVAVILGVSLFSPTLVRPLAAIAGKPLEVVRKLTGRLARENTQRNPARTAVTAAALMIGLAVVAFVTVFAAGIKSSIASAVDDSFQGQLVIQNTDGFSPISPGAAAAARKVPGVELVATMRTAQAKVVGGGGKPKVSSLPPDAGEVLSIDWTEGGPATLRRLDGREVILDKSFAGDQDLEVGDSIRFLTQTGKRPKLRVVGEFDDRAELFGSAIVTPALMASQFDQTDDTIDFVKLAPGADAAKVQAALIATMKREFPIAEVRNQQELKENQEEQVNQLLGLIYALLALAIIVSLFGIANTLALSIHERTRELGMLRAIGMSRRQVRTMIRYEAVITALIGALLGMVIGIVFAALIAQPLKDEGFVLSYPIPTLIALLVFAAVAGVIAAIAPARRASRLDVLEALQYE